MDEAKADEVRTYLLGMWASEETESTEADKALGAVPTDKLVTSKVTIYQPAEEKGNYDSRSYSKDACHLITTKYNTIRDRGCWTVDNLRCADSTKCLTWESNTSCYAGRISIPEVSTSSSFTCGIKKIGTTRARTT